jgi:hypothetical protein
MAIKHQIRMQLAQDEVKKAEAEAEAEAEAAEVGTEESPGQASLAVTSAVPCDRNER